MINLICEAPGQATEAHNIDKSDLASTDGSTLLSQPGGGGQLAGIRPLKVAEVAGDKGL